MSTIGILSWQNENGRTTYPLQPNTAVINNLIVDAKFVQFDAFIPQLQTIAFNSTDLIITILFDAGLFSASLAFSDYTSGIRHVVFYDNTRFLGRVVFGDGAAFLWSSQIGQILTFLVNFLGTTVRSIPNAAGVFSINKQFGDFVFTATDVDSSIFYNCNSAGNWIAFNAVENHIIPENPPVVLKQLNLTTPINNNVFIGNNDIVNVAKNYDGSLTFSLVGNSTVPNQTIVSSLGL